MIIRYFTQKGSVYIHQTEGADVNWYKRDKTGLFQPLVGAIHLKRARLQELLREYPTSVLDTTVSFGSDLAKEFFDDAKREHLADMTGDAETHIFFLLSRGENKYAIGYSSVIQRIEKEESPQATTAKKDQ